MSGPTAEQQAALDARNVSVALSAGAGCGKTFVLTERFLSHLDPASTPRLQLSALVAITFTDKAAREMRNRIRKVCRQRLESAPNDDASLYWLDLLRQLDSARVSTIHSFCGALLRAHAVEAGIDPTFTLLEEGQAAALRSEQIDNVLRRGLADQSPDVMQLVADYELNGLRGMLASLLNSRWPLEFDRWLGGQGDSPVEPELVDRLLDAWHVFFNEVIRPRKLEELLSEACEMLELIGQHPVSTPKMVERCNLMRDLLPQLETSDAPAQLLPAIIEGTRYAVSGKWPDESLKPLYKARFESLRETARKVQGQLHFDRDAARPAAANSLRLFALTRAVQSSYRQHKDELAQLDFDDLLRRAHDLLHAGGETFRRHVTSGIGLLMVDESQDTDPTQVELVRMLCGDQLQLGKLFLVGDFKQSIYRFRGADPAVFRSLRDETPAEGRLALTLNFRSQPVVLEFVNHLFAGLLAEEYEPLSARPEAPPRWPAVEFHWSTPAPPPEADADLTDEPQPAKPGRIPVADVRQWEATNLARRLRRMIDDREPLVRFGDSYRPVEPRDIAILLRAMSDVAVYEKALDDAGLDYYVVGGRAYYAQQEVYDLLNLLRAIETESDVISLAGALRSPFFSLADETLFWLATHRRNLADGLMAADLPSELSATEQTRVRFAADVLRRLRNLKDRLPLAALLQEALALTGYDAAAVAEFLGPRKLANLHKFVDQARQFDQLGSLTLADFIQQLTNSVDEQTKESLAATLGEDSDVIKLMTVHQSKGLEFPVVVVPDIARTPVARGATAAYTARLGPCARSIDECPIDGLKMYNEEEARDDEQERIRLFYVATTRAADHLILSAAMDNIESPTSGTWLHTLHGQVNILTGEPLNADPARPVVSVAVHQGPPDEVPAAQRVRASLQQVIEQLDGGSALPADMLRQLAPLAIDRSGQRRFSFSRLKAGLAAAEGLAGGDEQIVLPPGTIDAAELGTLVHEVLAVIDLAQPGRVRPIVAAHAAGKFADERAVVDEATRLVEQFLASPRAADIAAADDVLREVEFMLAWPEPVPPSVGRYLHGFIDCLYHRPDGQWVLCDYKSNQLAGKTVAEVAAGYELQMLIYALATEQALGVAPNEIVLHFLRTGDEFRVEFDAVARNRLRADVDRLIAAYLAAPEGRGGAAGASLARN